MPDQLTAAACRWRTNRLGVFAGGHRADADLGLMNIVNFAHGDF